MIINDLISILMRLRDHHGSNIQVCLYQNEILKPSKQVQVVTLEIRKKESPLEDDFRIEEVVILKD